MNTCYWHNPNDEGKYNFSRFEDQSGKEAIEMSFAGAQITLFVKKDGVEVAHMYQEINYCPICGKRLRLGEEIE